MKWDTYFYDLAQTVAYNSKCLSRQIGAILVRDNDIIATGYNGPPRGIPHCNVRHNFDGLLCKAFEEANVKLPRPNEELFLCPRVHLKYPSNQGLHLCPATHAEANCIAQAARTGVSTKDSTMYVTCGIPCKNCLALLINAGVVEVVCINLNYYDELSKFILGESDLIIRTYQED